MKLLILSRTALAMALMLAAATPVYTQDDSGDAKDPNDGKLVDCGADKAVLFGSTTSPDGRYAAAWTLRRTDRKAKPVDWSKWDPGKADEFLDDYNLITDDATGPYELLDCIVDLKKKTVLPLPSSWPYWPNKNHGDFDVVWHQGADGTEYAAVFNEARWFTEDVWLVEARGDKMKSSPLVDSLNNGVARILKTNRPLAYDAYVVSFSPNSNDNVATSFTKTAVVIGFYCQIPKKGYEDVNGSATVDLASGKIVATKCDTKRDDPFLDNPDLAKADKELNEVYAALLAKLTGAKREKLREQQRYWLENRDYASPSDPDSKRSTSIVEFKTDHLNAVPDLGEDDDDAAFNKKRDESLIQSTKARTAVLKKQLATASGQAAPANPR